VRQRIRSWWFNLQSTLWFIPAIMTSVATALALLLLRLDQRILNDPEVTTWWLFEGGAEGARGVLSTIAGTMITVVTTAFSITIVALQLASTQFSPRILKSFTGDRGNQLVLGMFIATFAYTVVVLRAVRSELSDQDAFVPSISVTLAILLAFAAIGSLIYFFHHAARSIQASVVIERAVHDTFTLIDARLAHEPDGNGHDIDEVVARDDLVVIPAQRSGYLTDIDAGKLLKVASEHDVVLTVTTQVGDHLFSNSPLVSVPAASLRGLSPNDIGKLEEHVQRAFVIEMERTLEQDLLLGFRQLSDIAIKALSPGINDPTTATIAIDRMGEGLLRLRGVGSDIRFVPAPNGRGGVREAMIGFGAILDQSVPQIRHYGAGDVVVMVHLVRVLGRVADGAPPAARAALIEQARLTADGAVQALTLEADRQRVRAAAAWAQMAAV